MIIAIDGACKRNGTPQCLAAGVAWIKTEDGGLYYKADVETLESTNQRGELMGLLAALKEAATTPDDEDIVIITDSEYLFNSVALEWSLTWEANNYIGSSGQVVKNADLWQKINDYIHKINKVENRIYMQWTKGHLVHYTAGNITKAMMADPSGVELFARITAMANRPADKDRIISDFIYNRTKHEKDAPPKEVCLEWAIFNATADAIATFVVKAMDAQG